MITYAYDVECFKNFFGATFVNVENENDKYSFYIGLGRDDKNELIKFLKNEMILVGFNNHSYDDPTLRFVMGYKGTQLTADLYALSAKLVDEGFRNDKQLLQLRYPKDYIYKWRSVDLMRIMAFDKLGISLKQVAINLKWHLIQDLPISPYEKVHENQIAVIMDYNLNDVLITKRLYEEITPLRELRAELSKLYHVDLSSASDSRMANLILENIYSNELKMDIRAIRELRTVRDKVYLRDCVAKFVEFKSPELKELLDRITATIVYEYNGYKYNETIYFANCTFALGIGGLHSEDAPGIFETTDKHIIRDMDVASYYPNLIINNNFYPQHLGIGFIKVLKKITTERLAAKKAKDKVKADGLKITINSIFGKLGSPTFWLLDARPFLSTTLSGQLGLLMLIEDLYLNGIEVISCNTDGIVCRIPVELEDKYKEVAKNWEKKTNLELEFTTYKKYVRRDVNTYITEKKDGSTKEKGAFLKEVDLKKSYHMPIVAKALYAYFIKGIPVKNTLEKCKDIMEFCISQKSGKNFSIELHTTKGIEHLQKTNRFYITKKGGSLLKREFGTQRLIGLYVNRMVRILNNFDPKTPFEDYEVDLGFYEKEVMKIVDEIEPKQLNLFDMTTISKGSLIRQTISASPKPMLHEEKLDIRELNKLGKNQFVKKLESMVENYQTIEKISPRYVYVINFDAKNMEAEIYSFAKGIRQPINVNKDSYKNKRIEAGQLVYCHKFEKLEYGHAMLEYDVVDKIEEEKLKLL